MAVSGLTGSGIYPAGGGGGSRLAVLHSAAFQYSLQVGALIKINLAAIPVYLHAVELERSPTERVKRIPVTNSNR